MPLLKSLLHKVRLWLWRRQNIYIGENAMIAFSAKILTRSRKQGSIRIGNSCRIGPNTIIDAAVGSIEIGNNVSVNPFTIIYGHGGVRIGDDVRIANHVSIISSEHQYKNKNTVIWRQPYTATGIEIKNDIWLASGVRILDGSIVETGCVIGAGAVLKAKTEPYSIYVGVPAKKISERE